MSLMRPLVKFFMALQVGLYRRSGGKLGGQMGALKLLLLTSTGRKTGRPHTVPIAYFERSDGYVVVGSNAGQSKHPAWYFNLKSQPRVSMQVGDRVMPATAEVLSGDARAQAWQQVIAAAPQFAQYEKNTTREIPLVWLRPDPPSA